jgi:hypothetical protein
MIMNLRPENLKDKCVHVLCIDDWYPEFTQYTLPFIKAWADKIGADFNLISKRKFPDFPINYERFQIFEDGKNYFWNINIDADYMIHPDMEDPTEGANPYVVMSEGRMDTSSCFKPNIYFLRDERNQALGDSFIVSSIFTHDVWTPLAQSFEKVKDECLIEPRQISEFAVSLNVARFGLKYDGAIKDKTKIYHIATSKAEKEKYDPVQIAKDYINKWGVMNVVENYSNKSSSVEKEYNKQYNTPSDINEHLPVLFEYAKKCDRVTEFGVRKGVSTLAFLYAKPKIITSYDIEYDKDIENIKTMCRKENINWNFIIADTLNLEIQETDFLFIDTLHTYGQLKKELSLHHKKVKKYIGFHDTITFGVRGEDGGAGLMQAIEEFLKENPEWIIDLKKENNNGLMILKNINNT